MVGQYVLSLYEEYWCRAVLVKADQGDLMVHFVDYGNRVPAADSQMLHLPRHFSHVPAMAVKIHLDGLANSTDEEVKRKSKDMLTVCFYVVLILWWRTF